MTNVNQKNVSNIIAKITYAAITLAIALIFNFISSYLNIFNFLQINLTLIPIFIASYILSWRWALVVSAIRFLISPLLFNYSNMIAVEYVGNLIIFLSHTFFISFYYLCYKLVCKRKWDPHLKFLLSSLFSVPLTIILLTFLNTYIFNVVYFFILNILDHFSLSELIAKYPNFKILFFNINNYHVGSWTLYTVFNIINLSINVFVISLFVFLDRKTKIFSNIKYRIHELQY
ncbi:MPN527 family putative ECF transporter permease subunit [Mycoplasmopsis gallinacea]|uniref:MPN527 family putative ECF transporter permease subunit n=1 Tax=Mycoplasmopsis gallinacea TaxID=29556 RepID=UPI003531314E